jgi:LAS superfamily LD-carboxypeptidase LdcB
MMRSPLALLVALLPFSVSAQTIYKCVDVNGNTTYASARIDKNCKVISSGPENAMPAPPRAKPAGAAANPSPAGFPRVQEDTQRARDGDRRHILEQELAGEQRNLEQARKDLSEQQAAGSSSDRLAPYRDRVGQHERNIQAIQKELGNLK